MSDNWDFYMTQVDGNLASIFVDLGISEIAPVENLPLMAYIRVYMTSPRDDGLSSQEESSVLFEIEDDIESIIKFQVKPQISFVGRNTSDGCRDFFFYTGNGFDISYFAEKALEKFSNYRYETGAQEDPHWETYFQFLFPAPFDWQLLMNRRVFDNLQSKGDVASINREFLQWINFRSDSELKSFIEELEPLEYEVKKTTHQEENKLFPYSVCISKFGKSDLNSINELTLTVFDLAKRLDGDYDGWETSVER